MRSFVLVALMFGLVGLARADGDADRLFRDGKRLLAKKSYAKACAAFEQSYDVDPAIGTQANIALCYEKWGKWPDAYRAYSKAAQMAREANDDRFTALRAHAERAGRKVARLAVRIPQDADPRATYTLDGEPVERGSFAEELVLAPGKHSIEARVPGHTPVREDIELEAGARELLQLEVARGGSRMRAETVTSSADQNAVGSSAPKDAATGPSDGGNDTKPVATRKRGRLLVGLASSVTGAAAIGVSSYIALDARSDYKAAAGMCPGGMCETPEAYAATRDARSRARKMTYVFVGGAGLAALGVYLIATSKPDVAMDGEVAASLFFTDHGAGLAIGGSL